MKRLFFWLVYPSLLLLSLFPLTLLYFFSDLLFFLLYYIIRYRKDLVLTNLQRSFPEKNVEELLKIRLAFFKYLADTFIETIKTFTIRTKGLRRRFTFDNLPIVDAALDSGRHVMIVLGHYGNWEWGAGAIGHHSSQTLTAPYTPLRHQQFNDLMVRTRTRYGLRLLPKKQLIPYLKDRKDSQHFLALIADQSPNPKKFNVINFMNQETAVVKGMENIARDFDFMVYFASIRYIKRGYYTCHFELLTDHASEMHEGDLTTAFMKKLERDIQKDPVHYLWSHNRWKLTTNKKLDQNNV